MSIHEEVLGKAYDGRLMRRLLGYLRPSFALTWRSHCRDHRPLGAAAGAAVLTKIVIDYIPAAICPGSIDRAGVSPHPARRRSRSSACRRGRCR